MLVSVLTKFHAIRSFLRYHKRLPNRNALLFNDQWYRLRSGRELYNPLRQFITDKEYLKIFVRAELGDDYNVPTIAVFDRFEAFKAADLPENCVIKPTHLSGGDVIFRRNGKEPDHSRIEKWFNKNYFPRCYEANYRYLEPKVIVEPFVFGSVPEDYKIFCYNGRANVMRIDYGRFQDQTRALFYKDGTRLNFSISLPMADESIARLPDNWQELFKTAETLSARFKGFLRVDLYTDGKEILVSEITNCSGGARLPFVPVQAEFEHSHLFFDD